MWDKLRDLEVKFEEIAHKLTQPEIAGNPKELMRLTKEHSDLSEIVATYRAHKKATEELAGAKVMLNERGMEDIAKEEIRLLEGEIEGLEKELQKLLLPKDPNDEKNVILEVRAGTGGDEAGLFAAELFRAYTRYCEGRKWKVEILSASDATSGGYKEVIALVSGKGAFSRLKYERGVHRVQRVPVTETQGRVHTSTITVAVLPEAEEVEVDINQNDLRIDVFRSSGAGGQSVNTTDSAVRITHIPTNTVVVMMDERSQHKNKEKAMRVLRSRILEAKQEAAYLERRDDRRSQVGTGERSEKIRTYNFPQSRVTDHRIGLSLHSLDAVMGGDLDPLIDPITAYYQAEALRAELN